jgi:hypothetical protein
MVPKIGLKRVGAAARLTSWESSPSGQALRFSRRSPRKTEKWVERAGTNSRAMGRR